MRKDKGLNTQQIIDGSVVWIPELATNITTLVLGMEAIVLPEGYKAVAGKLCGRSRKFD